MRFSSSYSRSLHAIAKRTQRANGWHYHTCLAFAARCLKQTNGVDVIKIGNAYFRRTFAGELVALAGALVNSFADLQTIKGKGKHSRGQRRRNQASAMQSKTQGRHVEYYWNRLAPECTEAKAQRAKLA